MSIRRGATRPSTRSPRISRSFRSANHCSAHRPTCCRHYGVERDGALLLLIVCANITALFSLAAFRGAGNRSSSRSSAPVVVESCGCCWLKLVLGVPAAPGCDCRSCRWPSRAVVRVFPMWRRFGCYSTCPSIASSSLFGSWRPAPAHWSSGCLPAPCASSGVDLLSVMKDDILPVGRRGDAFASGLSSRRWRCRVLLIGAGLVPPKSRRGATDGPGIRRPQRDLHRDSMSPSDGSTSSARAIFCALLNRFATDPPIASATLARIPPLDDGRPRCTERVTIYGYTPSS